LKYESNVNEVQQQLAHSKKELNNLTEQNKMLNSKLEKQQNNLKAAANKHNDNPKKSEQERIHELKQKLDGLQKKYDDLTEQNNDLLVYLGYLHDEQDKMQNKLQELSDTHVTESSTAKTTLDDEVQQPVDEETEMTNQRSISSNAGTSDDFVIVSQPVTEQ